MEKIYLVAAGSGCMTQATLALNEAIGEEGGMRGTVGLLGFSFFDEPIFPQSSEHVLDDLGMLRSWSAAEDVEIDLEPGIYVAMNSIILGTQCGRVYTLC